MKKVVQELKDLCRQERLVLGEILRRLRVVEREKIFLEMGYSSLFAFCCQELDYSETEAHTRIQAMRLIRAVPEVEKKIETGELSLTVAAKAQGCIKREKIEEKAAFIASFVGTSVREADRKIAELFPEAPKRERARVISGEFTRIEFNASKALVEKFERLKELLAHKNFSGRWDLLFEELAEVALKKLEPREPKAVVKLASPGKASSDAGAAPGAKAGALKPPQAAKLSSNAPILVAPPVLPSRYLPVEVRRQVYRRDKGHCQFKSPEGRLCQSRHGIQVDHILPYAEQGPNTPENLRLLCGAHNRGRNSS